MKKPSQTDDDFFKKACYIEAGLVLVALALGWLANINPFENLHFSESAILYGLIGTMPLFVMFLALEYMQIESIVKIKKMLLETLGPGLYQCHWTDVFMLSAIAGLSEELLFRGVIQPWMASSWGYATGLVASNIVFGLVHAVTPLYAVVATLVGVYLSMSMNYGGDHELLIPITIHGFYDFLALQALLRSYRLGN